MGLRQFQHYVDGAFGDGAGGTFESIDPASGEPWALMPAAEAGDVDRAVRAAHRAFHSPEWAGMTASRRGRLLCRLGDLVAGHAAELAELETRDTGKIIRETSAQIAYCADYYRYYGGLADKIEGAPPADRQAGHGDLPAARADRRRRRHGAVELAALPVRGEARAGARRRRTRS